MFIEIEDLKQEPLHVQHVFKADEIGFAHEDATLNEPVTADFILDFGKTPTHPRTPRELGDRFDSFSCAI